MEGSLAAAAAFAPQDNGTASERAPLQVSSRRRHSFANLFQDESLRHALRHLVLPRPGIARLIYSRADLDRAVDASVLCFPSSLSLSLSRQTYLSGSLSLSLPLTLTAARWPWPLAPAGRGGIGAGLAGSTVRTRQPPGARDSASASLVGPRRTAAPSARKRSDAAPYVRSARTTFPATVSNHNAQHSSRTVRAPPRAGLLCATDGACLWGATTRAEGWS